MNARIDAIPFAAEAPSNPTALAPQDREGPLAPTAPAALHISNEDFLQAVIGELKAGESAWICGFPEAPTSKARWGGQPVKLGVPHFNINPNICNTYYSVAVLAGNKRQKKFSSRMAVLVVDDVVLETLLAPPSYVIETSPGNHQAGYIISSGGDDPVKCDRVMAALHAKGLLGSADKSGNNVVRYVRLPVGVNTKLRDSGPFAHRLTAWRPELRYTLDDAAAAVGVDSTEAKAAPQVIDEGAPTDGATSMSERLFQWRAAITDPHLDKRSYHDALNKYAASLLATRMAEGAVVELLRAEMMSVKPTAEQCQTQGKSFGTELQRWQERYDDIPSTISTAQEKFSPPERDDIVVVNEREEESPSTADRIPGVLGLVEDYYNQTSVVPQAAFASVASIALGSVALGRLYAAQQGRLRSYPSQFLCEVVGTGGGKEHAHTVVEEFLIAAELGALIGPAGYTSAAGVYSALLSRPNHLAYLNELGRQMAAAKVSKDSLQQQAFTELMMVWSSLNKVYRYRGYAMTTISDAQKAQLDKSIPCPAITLIGASTRRALFDAVGAAGVEDGLLDRLLFFFGDDHAQADAFALRPAVDLPGDVVGWLTRVRNAKGNIWSAASPETKPDPVILPYDAQALEVLRALQADVRTRIDASKSSGISELWARTVEKAIRLAVIAAVSDGCTEIQRTHAEWAARRAMASDSALKRVAAGNISESKHGKLCNAVFREISKAGALGMSAGRLSGHCRPYRDATIRERKEALDMLLADGRMKKVNRLADNGHRGEYLIATRIVNG